MERHFGVRFAFQSCHPAAAVPGAAYRAFVSPRSQVLNQTPGLRHR